MTTEEAIKLLQEQQQAQVQACLEEVNQVLERHGCSLTARPVLTDDGRIVAQPVILPVRPPAEKTD